MESTFDKLNQDIEAGIRGETQSIPIGLPKLGKYTDIRKNILTLLFSTTGAGKSSMLDTMILNACENHMNSPSTFKMKPDFQLFSMERASKIRVAKWVSFFVFRHEGVEIQIPRMLGWWNEKLSKKDLLKLAKDEALKELKASLNEEKTTAQKERDKEVAEEVKAFAKSHEDFDTYRPIMYGLSLDPKYKKASLDELYKQAKEHVKRIHTEPSDEEKKKSKSAGSGHKPDGHSSSYDKDKKMSAREAAESAWEEVEKELGPIPSM